MILKYRFCIFLNLAFLSTLAFSLDPRNPIITKQEETDLNLFQSESNKSLFDTIDRTISKVGRDALQAMVRTPLNRISELEQRKKTVKFLIDSPELIEKIKNELHAFSKHEQAVDILWEPQDNLCKTALEDFYFENSRLKHLNGSPRALNVLQVAHIGTMFAPLIEHLVFHFVISHAWAERLGIDHVCTHDHHHSGGALEQALYKLYNVAHWTLHAYGVKQLYEMIKQKAAIAKTVQANLIAANRCLQSLKNVYALTKDNKGSLQDLAHFSSLEAFFELKESKELIKLLEANTFAGAPSLMSNIGNILAAYTQVQQAPAFKAAILALGEIDAYISIATLYNDFQNTQTPFSFAQYATSDTPFINAQAYWNPLIDNAQSTSNFAIGLRQPAVAIITGPNAAGKSTNLKSMALLALFAQTFTIAPAHSLELTPFSKIGTFINHSDSAGASLFTTELIKANMLIDTLNNKLDKSEFSLIVFDELFKSTSPEKGQEKAYSLIKYLGNFKNNLCMVSTHFAKLTILETENATVFKNYTAQAHQNEQGAMIYALQEGSSLPSQSFDILAAQGIQGVWEI